MRLSKRGALGDRIDPLSNEYDVDKSNPYTSVLIGSNGTGKSFILRTIAEIFRQFNEYQKSGKKDFNLPYDIHLRYKFYHNTYEIVTRKLKLYVGNSKKKEYCTYPGGMGTAAFCSFPDPTTKLSKVPDQD